MDKSMLDLLLREQNGIEDDNFTSTVMTRLPKFSTRKLRGYILIGMMSFGVILSFAILPSEKLLIQFFKVGISGEIFSKLVILSIVLYMLSFFFCFLSVASEEL